MATKQLKEIQMMFGAAMVSCAAVLACAWPTDTHADDAESAAAEPDIGADTTKMGALQATTRLVQDDKVKGKWYVEVKVHNTGTQEREAIEVSESLEKTVFQPMMARGGPVPSKVWQAKDKLEVLPKETVVVRHALPAWLNPQVSASIKPPKLDKQGNPVMQSTTMFATSVGKAS
jgi:hypothetical protein